MKIRDILNQINKISQDIGTSKVYICGGIPRDKILNKLEKVSDIDLTTGDNTIKNLAKECSIKFAGPNTTYKTMDDGHSKLIIDGVNFDFSSNYIIPNLKEYFESKNETKSSLDLEMYSRDFTCNSLLLDFDLETILDPLNRGISDIEGKMLKTCLDPSITLGVDNKRISRAIYLAAKLGFNLDPQVFNWIKENPEKIATPGNKYVSKRINKALFYNKEYTIQLLDDLGLWSYIPTNKGSQDQILKEII
jgi:tRNA nucleotidyltransferase/poly(A) polymerase